MRRLARPLMYVGVVAVVFGLSEYHGRNIGFYEFRESFRLAWAITYAGLLCATAYGLGLPEVPRTVRSRLPMAMAAPAIGAVVISLIQLFVGDALLPRFVVFGAAMLLVPWFYAMSSLAGAGRAVIEQRDRVVVIGPPTLVEELEAELTGTPERPASVAVCLSEIDAANVGEGVRPLIDAVLEHRASVIVLSARAQEDERIIDQAAALHEAGVRVRTQSLFYEEWLGKLPVADLGRVSLFFDIGEVHRDRFGRVKRVVDLAAGILGLFPLLVVIPVVVLGDLVANPGPLFYLQDRVGRGGDVFRIFKFRTMRADSRGPGHWTQEDDPRVTPFGSFLRKTHLDELPQVLNILKGDLSLVGPRPEQPHYVAELVQKLPYYDLRHVVRPGLTGWAQVKYGYAGDERDALEKLQYDFHYLRRQSVSFDLRIVARTLRAVVGGEGSGR